MATVVSPLLINHQTTQTEQQAQTLSNHPIDQSRSQSPRITQSQANTLKVKQHQDVELQYEYQDEYEYESHTEAHHSTPRSTLLSRSRPFQQPTSHLDRHDADSRLTHIDYHPSQEETSHPPSTRLNPESAISTTNHTSDPEESSLAQDLSSRLSYLALSVPLPPQGSEPDQPTSRSNRPKLDNPTGSLVPNGSNAPRGRRGRSSSVSLISGGLYPHVHHTQAYGHTHGSYHHAQHNLPGRWRSPYHNAHPAVIGGGGVPESGQGQGQGQRQGRRARARSQLYLPATSGANLPIIEVLAKTAPISTSDLPERKDDDETDHEEKARFQVDFPQSPHNPTCQPGVERERGRTRTNVTILEVPDSPPVSSVEGGFESNSPEWSGTTSEFEDEGPDEEEDETHVKVKREERELMGAFMEDVTPRNTSITPGKKEKRVRMGSRVRFEHLHHHSPSPHSLVHHTSHPPPTARDKLFDPYTATIPTLIHLLQSSLIASTQIIETYLSQINLHNPTLRALTWVREREDVMREARVCDLYRSRGWVDWERKPLWGVPIVVKDNIATDEELGMPTTAGSFALLGMPVKKDAFIVRKLREAGAIILAKANMSELADYKSAHAGAGWSAVGGQTINVYAAHASPGTSSSGNGVSVAAGFCPASIGTETDGSITLPCLQSCLYGLKPTVGMLSRSGVVPFAPYFDTPGPMAKDVKSLAILMDVMCARDDEDVKTLEVDRIPCGVKYVDSCNAPSFEGLRIGIPRANWHNIDPWRRPGRDELVPEIANPFEQVIEMMAMNGAAVQDPADIPSAVDGSLWECSSGSRSMVVAADCNHYLGKYLQNLGGSGGCRSVADIIAFNEEHADIEMPPGHHGQEVLKRCLDAVSVDSDEYARAKADMKLVAGKRGLDAVMDEYDLDALFMIREGHHSAANMVGYPIAAVPIGVLSDNTPYGAFFIGRKHGEQTLLRIMAAWEATFGARPLPPIATEA